VNHAADGFEIHSPEDVARLLDSLREKLRSLAPPAGAADGSFHVIRAEVPVRHLDLLTWLSAQYPRSRGYWCDREGRFELAGIGTADLITGDEDSNYGDLTAALRRKLTTAGPPVRYFGGLRFGSIARQGEEWRRFGAYRFVLPRCELVRRDDRISFACNMRMDEPLERVLADLDRVVFPLVKPDPLILRPLARLDLPDAAGWNACVGEVRRSIGEGTYEKIVLSRRSTFSFASRINAVALLQQLKAITRQRFHFCFQPDEEFAFVGASPERLFRRDGRALQTEAIAGTHSRGANPQEDESLRKVLLSNDKEQREHQCVVDGIRSVLDGLCTQVTQTPKPSVLLLVESQHLITSFNAVLRDGVTDAQLLEGLHPTPAVGGFPRESALPDIPRLEPFDRGWFAAPVGWMTRDAAQFAVGIRSALVAGAQVHVYAGAGLVAGSTAEGEWDEVDNKVKDYLKVFGSWQGRSVSEDGA